MAFYNRLPLVIAALVVPTFYANMDANKWLACAGAVSLVVFTAIWVSIFAWKKPAHLLSGEETHLERYKIEYMQGLGSGKGSTQPLGGVAEEVQH